jgi:hypothetical protein
MLRKQLFGFHANRLHADLEAGGISAGALVTFPQGLSSLVAITSQWYETAAYSNYHVFEIGSTLPPAGFKISGGENWWVDSGGHVQVGRGRRVFSIDIVSYEVKTRQSGSNDLVESLKYDRALIFEFDQGEPLTLTSKHGGIEGGIEIKVGRSPGFQYDEGTFSTRLTLH